MSELANAEPIDEEDRLLSELNFQQETFVKAYCANGRNGAGAAREAGYACPEQAAYRMLRTPHIKAYIDYILDRERELVDAQLRARHFTKDRVLEELATIAGFDLGEIITMHGGAPTIDLLKAKEEHTRVLSGIETEKSGGKTKVKVKVYDKLRALDMIANIMGLTKQAQVNVQVNVDFGERMAARRARALEGR